MTDSGSFTISTTFQATIGVNQFRSASYWNSGGWIITGYNLVGYSLVSSYSPVDYQLGGTITISNRGYVLYLTFEKAQYTVTTRVNNSAYGSASGGGTFEYGESCTVTATPSTGYHFVNWTGTVTSTSNPYIISSVGQNYTLTANFAPDTFTITAVANNSSYGSVDGDGIYEYNTQCTLIASPYTGYQFSYWQKDGTQYSTSATLVISNVTQHMDFIAVFEPIILSVTAVANDPSMGEVTGGGNYNYGASCTIQATPYNGYRFLYWLLDSAMYSNDNSVTINSVEQDMAFTAVFEEIICKVTIAQYTSDFYTSNIQPEYRYDTTVSLNIAPNDNRFVFLGWYNTSGELLTNNNTYTFQITTDVTLVPQFAFAFDSMDLGYASHLYWLAEYVNAGFSFVGVSFYLTNDIDLTKVSDSVWQTIGNTNSTFAGEFFGGSYKIVGNATDTLFYTDTVGNIYDVKVVGINLGVTLNDSGMSDIWESESALINIQDEKVISKPR